MRSRTLIVILVIVALCIFFLILLHETGPPAQMEVPSLLWRYETGGYVESSPALGDIDGDGSLEVVVGSRDHYVYAIESNGTLLWRYETGDWVDSSPALGDIDGDGSLEVVVGSGDHYVYAIESNGTLLWRYETGGYVDSSPALGDIDGDGSLEVVVGSRDHYVYAIESNGTLLWRYETGGYVRSSPALGDIDGDGSLEVVVGSDDSYVYAIESNGTLLWRYETGGWVDSSPALGDIDGDGSLEVVVGSRDHYVYAIESNGTLLWRYETGDWVDSSPALGDIDGDGGLEVVVGSWYIYAIESNGTLLWRYETGGCVDSSPALGDIDGDGSLEVVVGSRDHYVYAIESNGTLLWRYETGGYVRSSPALGDIDGDGSLEVVVGSGHYVYAINVNGKRVFWEGLGGAISSGYHRTKSAADVDPDGDMLWTYSESLYGTDPSDPDSDGDGMPDGWEVLHSLDPLADDANDDPDGDGLSNVGEYNHNTDPNDPDSDGDGLDDNAEVSVYGTDPNDPDTDDDGMPDGWEVSHSLNPFMNDANDDPDGDGLSNINEYLRGKDPQSFDIDSPVGIPIIVITVVMEVMIVISIVAVIKAARAINRREIKRRVSELMSRAKGGPVEVPAELLPHVPGIITEDRMLLSEEWLKSASLSDIKRFRFSPRAAEDVMRVLSDRGVDFRYENGKIVADVSEYVDNPRRPSVLYKLAGASDYELRRIAEFERALMRVKEFDLLSILKAGCSPWAIEIGCRGWTVEGVSEDIVRVLLSGSNWLDVLRAGYGLIDGRVAASTLKKLLSGVELTRSKEIYVEACRKIVPLIEEGVSDIGKYLEIVRDVRLLFEAFEYLRRNGIPVRISVEYVDIETGIEIPRFENRELGRLGVNLYEALGISGEEVELGRYFSKCFDLLTGADVSSVGLELLKRGVPLSVLPKLLDLMRKRVKIPEYEDVLLELDRMSAEIIRRTRSTDIVELMRAGVNYVDALIHLAFLEFIRGYNGRFKYPGVEDDFGKVATVESDDLFEVVVRSGVGPLRVKMIRGYIEEVGGRGIRIGEVKLLEYREEDVSALIDRIIAEFEEKKKR